MKPPPQLDCGRLDFAACPRCAGDGFLTLVREKTLVGANGKPHAWETVLFQNMKVKREDLEPASGQS